VSVLLGPRHSIWVRGLTPSQRLGLAAWCVRPLSGMRRVLFVAVVLAALLAGQAPFHVAAAPVMTLWAPSIALTSLGVIALAAGTLRLGDRARWSLRTMAPSLAGLAGPESWPGRGARVGAVMRNGGLVALLVVLDAAVVLRAASDRWLDLLPPASRGLLAVLLLVVLWLEAMALDELRLLARGRRRRRAVRHLADLPGSLDGVPATIADLTVLGAGVALARASQVGDDVALVVSVPDGPRTEEVRVAGVVRNSRRLDDGRWRLGVEFTEVSAAAAVALTEWCVVRPARAGLGEEPAVSPAPWIGRDDDGPGRSWIIQVTSLVAVVGVVAMMLPAAARAEDEPTRSVEGVLVTDLADPLPGALVTAVCAHAPGLDQRWGTTDDRYRGPVSDRTDADGRYRLPLGGDACWLTLAPPLGYRTLDPALAGTAVPIDGDDPLLTVLTATATPVSVGGAAIDGVVRDDDGVNGVTVALLDGAGQLVDTTVSRSRGHFSFGDLAAGTYALRVSNLPGGLVADPATPAAVLGDLGTVAVADGQRLGEVALVVGQPVARVAAPDAPALLPETSVAVPAEPDDAVLLPIAVTAIALVLGISLLVQAERLRRARDRHPSSSGDRGLAAAGMDR
jgi:hypothetical protein